MEKTKETLEVMKKISLKRKDNEFNAIIYAAESVIEQLFQNKQSAINKIIEAMKSIQNLQDKHPETFYRILYTHTLFTAPSEPPYSKTIKKLEECYSYYYKSNNSLGLILAA